MIPYGKQTITDLDKQAVLEVLNADFLTTGPKVACFENAFAEFIDAKHAVAVSNGTSALHTALAGLGIKPGDEVIVPAITFVATANAVLYQGAIPVFADVNPLTLLIEPEDVERKITAKTRAIIAVDYAGQLCDYIALKKICRRFQLFLVADSCHAPGATHQGKSVTHFVDAATYSFHPVKHLTTAEGGMIASNCGNLSEKMRVFRNHGITSDHSQRQKEGIFHYEMTVLGFNYRLSDLQCALGLSQLKQLPEWIKERKRLAHYYDNLLKNQTVITPLSLQSNSTHTYHLYVIKVPRRNEVIARMREKSINCNVHYLPVYLHPYYQEKLGPGRVSCPVAEDSYQHILTIPLYPGLSSQEQEYIVESLLELCSI